MRQQGPGGAQPALHEPVSHGVGNGQVIIRPGRQRGDVAAAIEEVFLNCPAQRVDADPGSVVIDDRAFV